MKSCDGYVREKRYGGRRGGGKGGFGGEEVGEWRRGVVWSAWIALQTVKSLQESVVPLRVVFCKRGGGEGEEVLVDAEVSVERNAFRSGFDGVVLLEVSNAGSYLTRVGVSVAIGVVGTMEEELARLAAGLASARERYEGKGPLEEPYNEASAPPGSFLPLPEPERPSVLRFRPAFGFPDHGLLRLPFPLPTSPAMAPPPPPMLLYLLPKADTKQTSRMLTYAVDLFFSNKFFDSMRLFGRDRNRLPLAALGAATISFLRALLTFRPQDMTEAQRLTSEAHSVAAQYLPPESMLGSLSRYVVSEELTPEQLMAVLASAEASLVSACLHFLSETAIGFVQGGLAIRNAHIMYTRADAAVGGRIGSCPNAAGLNPAPMPRAFGGHTIDPYSDLPREEEAPLPEEVEVEKGVGDMSAEDAVHRPPPPPPGYDPKFDDEGIIPVSVLHALSMRPEEERDGFAKVPFGLARSTFNSFLFGMGGFNVVASTLPPIITSVISVLGYPCDRARGIVMERACLQSGGARSPLAAACLLMLYALFPSFLPRRHRPFDRECRVVITHALSRYPTSVMFLWLAGRFERGRGRLSSAVRLYQRAMGPDPDGENKPDTVRALCVYEIGFAELSQLSWRAAQQRFEALANGTSWSKAFFTYAAGVLALTRHDGQEETSAMFAKAPELCERRVNGRPISAEQFVLKRVSEISAASDQPAYGTLPTTPQVEVSGSVMDRLQGPLPSKESDDVDLTSLRRSRVLLGSVFTVSRARIIRAAQTSSSSSSAGEAGEEGGAGVEEGVGGGGKGSLVWALRCREAAPLAIPTLELIALFNGVQCMGPSDLESVLLVLDQCLLLMAGMGVDIEWPESTRIQRGKSGSGTEEVGGDGGYEGERKGVVHALLVAALLGDANRVPEELVSIGGDGGKKHGAPPISLLLHTPIHAPTYREVSSLPATRFDDVALLAYLRGCVSAALGAKEAATAALHFVGAIGPMVCRDTYTIPHALYEEAAVLCDGEEAERLLSEANSFDRDYSFKIRMAFKIHLVRDATRWASSGVAAAPRGVGGGGEG